MFLIASQGPASLSFGEFNPLFNRDQVTFQGGLMDGEDGTYAGEAIVSGISGKFSFSAGYSKFQTDGFRENADQDDEIANVFAQVELGPNSSIQAEYRYRNNERGDLRLRFFPEDYYPGERNTEERNTARVGLKLGLSPGSILLASVMYQDAELGLKDDQPGFPLTFVGLERPESAVGSELQNIGIDVLRARIS